MMVLFLASCDVCGGFMKIYWRGTTIPELEGLPPDQQERIWRDATHHIWRLPRFWAAGVFYVVMMTIAFTLPRVIDVVSPENSVFWAICWAGLGLLISSQIVIHALRPLAATYRRTLDTPSEGESNADDLPPDMRE
jgi:hypothetical protein